MLYLTTLLQSIITIFNVPRQRPPHLVNVALKDSIQIVQTDENLTHAPALALSERYDTIDDAIRAAETEIQMIGVPGAVTYRILDEAGQPVPIPGPASR